MLLPPAEHIYMYFTGTKAKFEILKFIGWGMSGLIATLGVVGLLRRAAALDKQNEMTEKGHIQERFKSATEHLGNQQDSVRIAAFNEFYHVAKTEPDLRTTIFNILCAHLRQATNNKNCQKKGKESDIAQSEEIKLTDEESGTAESERIKPTEEVQSLLNILFKPHKGNLIFDDVASIKRANLQGANLRHANLQNAQLQKANMQKTYLPEANLQGAKLQDVNLQNSKINKNTKMPDGWKNIVKKDKNGKTGVLVIDDTMNIIEYL